MVSEEQIKPEDHEQARLWMQRVEESVAVESTYEGKTLSAWIEALGQEATRAEATKQLSDLGPIATAALLMQMERREDGCQSSLLPPILDVLAHLPASALAPFVAQLQALFAAAQTSRDAQTSLFSRFYLALALGRAGVHTSEVIRHLAWVAMGDVSLRRWGARTLGKELYSRQLAYEAEQWLCSLGLQELISAMFGYIDYQRGRKALNALGPALSSLGVDVLFGMLLGAVEGIVATDDLGSHELQWVHAVEVLASVGGEDVAGLFSELMYKDPDKFPASVIKGACNGLIAMGPEAIDHLVEHAHQHYEVLQALFALEDPRVHGLLVERVLPHYRIHFDYHQMLLDALLDFLARTPEATLAAIRRQLPDAAPQVCGYLAKGLAVCGEAAAPELLGLLEATEPATVLAALRGLGKAAPDLPDVRARLQLYAEHPSAELREAAQWSLSQGSTAEALALLLARFATPPEDHLERHKLVHELAASPVSNDDIRPSLLVYLDAPEDYHHRHDDIVKIIHKRKDTEAIPGLLGLAIRRESYLVRRIFEAIRDIGMGRWGEQLVALLTHENVELRCAVGETLLALDPETHAAQIMAMTIEDPDDDVRWALIDPLSRLVPGFFVEAIPSLLPWIREESFGPEPPDSDLFHALFAHAHPALLTLYRELARAPEAGGYLWGLEGLGLWGGVSDVLLLLEGFQHLCDDPNEVFWYVVTPLEALTTRVEKAGEDATGVAGLVRQHLSVFLQQIEDEDVDLLPADDDAELRGIEDIETLYERWGVLAATR